MIKFISKTLLFLLIAVLMYIALLFVWTRYSPSIYKPNIHYRIGTYGHNYSRLSEVRHYGAVDVLFLGSSHAYRGFDTRIFAENGYKTFNLGSSAQTPLQTKVLLQRYLDTLHPALVMYEVFPETFTIDGVESSFDLIANDINDAYSLRMALKINNIKTYNTLIYGYICDVLGLNNAYSEPVIKKDDAYVSGGYVAKEMSYYQPIAFHKNEIVLNEDQLATFADIVEMIQNKNIALMLVYAPIPKANYNSFSNNTYFDSIMKSYAPYYNFNETISLIDSLHFYDADHLNQDGVHIFNEKVMEVLKEKKIRRSYQ